MSAPFNSEAPAHPAVPLNTEATGSTAPLNTGSPVDSSINAIHENNQPVDAPNSLCELLTWKYPVATGKVFGSIVLALVLLKVNVLSKLFYIAYLVFLVSAAAEYAGKLFTGEGFVTKFKGKNVNSYAGFVDDSLLPAISKCYKCLESKVQKIVFAHDIELTLKTAGVAYIASTLTSWFSLYTIIFAFVVLAFTFPPVYVSNKKEIDAAVAHFTKLIKQKSAEATDKAHTAVAPHLNKLADKTGPVGSFVKSKFPTRTAGSTVGNEPIVEKPFEGAGSATTTGSSFPNVPSSVPSGVSEEPLSDAAVGETPVAVKRHL